MELYVGTLHIPSQTSLGRLNRLVILDALRKILSDGAEVAGTGISQIFVELS